MQGLVRQAALAGWRQQLALNGISVTEIEQLRNFNPNDTRTYNNLMALGDFVALLEGLYLKIRRSAFFWNAGENYDLRNMGAIGDAILSSKTLGGALRTYEHYFPLLQSASEMKVTVSDDTAAVSYRILDPSIWPRSRDAEFTLGIYSRLIRSAAFDFENHAKIYFETDWHEKGSSIGHDLDFCCFHGETKNLIKFPASWLSFPMPNHAPLPQKTENLDHLLVDQKRRTPLSDRVRCQIFKSIPGGKIDQGIIARELGMSRRTLRRKLAMQHINFQTIVDSCRLDFAALELARRPEARLSDIATATGYTEHSSFTRAFTRWRGMSPIQHRKERMLNY